MGKAVLADVCVKVVRLLTLVVLATAWQGQGGEGQLLSSTTRFRGFVHLDVSAGLTKYLQHETKRLEIIKKAKGYEEEVPLVKIRLEKLKSLRQELTSRKAELDTLRQPLTDFHPTSALRLVANFLHTWQDKLANDTLYGFRFAEFLSNNDDSRLPTQADLAAVASAVAEIQFVYNLSTADLYAGRVMGHVGSPLLPQDAYQVGLESWRLRHLKQAAAWLDVALAHTPEAEMDPRKLKNASYPVADAMAKLGILTYGMGERQQGLELLEKAADLDVDNADILRHFLTHRFGRNVEPLVHSDPGQLKMHWFRLCANMTSVPVVPVHWYHVCRYRRSSLVPYRVYPEEVLSRAPFVSLLHSFVSLRQAQRLINASKDKLIDYPVEGAENEQHLMQGSSLTARKVGVARELSDRITDVTGLDTTERTLYSSGEPVHVLNYGLSGSFLPHYDIHRVYYLKNLMRLSGQRMTTVLVYLSDVKAGGGTAFLNLNITVRPQLGSALLWHNARPDGSPETDLLHAGCPVAVGEKWVASKGVWSWGNELRRPCGRKLTSSHMRVDKIAPSRAKRAMTLLAKKGR